MPNLRRTRRKIQRRNNNTAGATIGRATPPTGRSTLVWAFDPQVGSAGQTHASLVGPGCTLGSTTGVDANDPVRQQRSYLFDINDYLNFADNLDATLIGAFTWQCNVKITAADIAATRAICDKGLGSNEFRMDGGKPTLVANYDPTGFTKYDVYGANVALTAGRYVVTVTRDPAQARGSRHVLYVAGSTVAATHTAVGVDGTISDTTSSLRLGLSTINTFTSVDQIGAVYLWTGVLSASDILTNAKWARSRGWL